MKTVLITGGSEGIGYALARCFAKEGWHLILVSRNSEKLAEAAERLKMEFSCEVEVKTADLSTRGAAEKLYENMKGRDIDAFINNAGSGYTGRCWDQPAEEVERMLELNVSSMMILASLFSRKMVRKGAGIIMNVASTGAFQPGPYIAGYYASKSFVLSYTRALREEIKGTGVKVFCLCPGPVRTGFYAKSHSKEPRYAMDANACARYAFNHLHQRHCVMIPQMADKFLFLVPQNLRLKAAGRMKYRMMETDRYASAG